MDRTRNAKRGLAAGFVYQFITLFLPFISRTLIINHLGIAYIGVGGLFSSILRVLSITELGFGSAVSYLLYKPIAEHDEKKIRAILNFTKRVFRVIGSVIIVVGLLLLPLINKLTSTDRPEGLNIYILYVIYLINTAISYFLFSYKRILLSASQRYDIETIINTISVLLQNILQIFVLVYTNNYYLYAFVTIVSTIINNLLCGYITREKYPSCYCYGKISEEDIAIVKRTAKGAFLSQIGSTVYLSADNIVISAVLGLVILGQYNNYYIVISALVTLFSIIHNTLRPILGNCIIKESMEYNLETLIDITLLYQWLVFFCCACLLSLFQDFITVWIGNEYLLPFYIVLLIVVYFYTGRMPTLISIFLEAAGLWWEKRYVYIIATVTNLTLNIILSNVIGLSGVLISSIVSSIGISLGGNAYVLYKYYFKDNKTMERYIKSFIINSLIGTITIMLSYFALSSFRVNNILLLFAKGGLTALVFGGTFLITTRISKNSMRALQYSDRKSVV